MKQGYGQFCPVAVACEIFAERWTPIILRSLFMGADRFNELLRGAPLISRSLLTKRLRDLERAGVVRRALPPRSRPPITVSAAGMESTPADAPSPFQIPAALPDEPPGNQRRAAHHFIETIRPRVH